MTISYVLENEIRKRMLKYYFIEGEDYYFGESILNGNTTIYFKPEVCKIDTVVGVVKDVGYWRTDFFKRGMRVHFDTTNLNESAFHINACIINIRIDEVLGEQNTIENYSFNVIEEGALEKALEKAPKRLERVYEKRMEIW